MTRSTKLLIQVQSLISISEEHDALGAALLNQNQARELVACADAEDFAYDPHRLIFEAMRRVGPPFEYGVLAGELQRQGQLEHAGGLLYITNLDWGVVPERPMTGRLKRLREWTRLRRLVQLGEQLMEAPYIPGANSVKIAHAIVQELSAWEIKKTTKYDTEKGDTRVEAAQPSLGFTERERSPRHTG